MRRKTFLILDSKILVKRLRTGRDLMVISACSFTINFIDSGLINDNDNNNGAHYTQKKLSVLRF